jgi:hypothetical protein
MVAGQISNSKMALYITISFCYVKIAVQTGSLQMMFVNCKYEFVNCKNYTGILMATRVPIAFPAASCRSS